MERLGKKLKVLVFIDWYLPGYKAGGPIQSVANLVDHLKDDFDFSIVTRDTDYCETDPYKTIKSNEWNILPDGTRVYYFSADQLTRKNIHSLIQKVGFDCVYLNGIYSLYFTLYPLLFLRKKCNKRIVIAARGMLAQSALGIKSFKKKIFLRSVKVLNLFDKVIFHATTKDEKQDIKKILGNNIEVKIAENLPQKLTGTLWEQKEKAVGSLKLVTIARISPEKNLLYALERLHFIKSYIEFDIYGPVYDKDYWNQCLKTITTLPENVKANYKGSIESYKVLEKLKEYHCLFMPTRGENFGHVILQSLSVGCPVIISDKTPWKELHKKNIGWDLPLQETELFVKVLHQCSDMNQATYNKMSQEAFKFAQSYMQNSEIIEKNQQLFY